MTNRLPDGILPLLAPETAKRLLCFDRHHLVTKGRFCWSKGQKNEQKIFDKKLKEYERLTLQQFAESNSVKLHLYNGNRPTPEPTSLDKEITDFRIRRFRINNKIRVLGYMHKPVLGYTGKHVFFICWIDWQHKTGD